MWLGIVLSEAWVLGIVLIVLSITIKIKVVYDLI